MKASGFATVLRTIMIHNDYPYDALTVTECNKIDRWTPTDLIMREFLNNGGGSAQGFLGITTDECIEAYDYAKEHIEELIAKDMVNETGVNNFGFPLWNNYNR